MLERDVEQGEITGRFDLGGILTAKVQFFMLSLAIKPRVKFAEAANRA